LQRAKKQIIGQMAINYESRLNEMLGIAKNMLHDAKVLTLEQLVSEIEQITNGQLLEVANEIFEPEKLSLLIFNAKEEYD
jgi:predicted Zn-dependent peptidase